MRNSPEAQKHMKPFFEIAKVDFHLYEVADAIEVRGRRRRGAEKEKSRQLRRQDGLRLRSGQAGGT